MSDRIVPDWARWCVMFGFAVPAAGYFFLKDYNPALGVVGNILTQDVVVPFLRGQNPFDCFNESLRNITGAPLGYDSSRSYGCTRPTQIPYLYVLLVSGACFLLGLYRHINPEQIANKWPTDWKVFNPENVKKKPAGPPPRFKNESPQDKPIKPHEGGF